MQIIFMTYGDKKLNDAIESLITQGFQETHILENIQNVINFTKSILKADDVVIWFESNDEKSFWSFYNDKKVFLSKDKISLLLDGRESIFIDNNITLIKEVNNILEYLNQIDNALFHKIQNEKNGQKFILEITNIKDKSSLFPDDDNDKDILQLLSLLLVQTINMKGISSLAKYYFDEQEKAYKKQKDVLQNDLENSDIFDVNIFYKPSDILNGDSYSIYKTLNGDILVYVLDAMGHGIGPSLTAYSISAIIQQKIKTSNNFNSLMESILDNVQYILTDDEQLTCGFFWFSKDLSQVEYVVAGMYAPMILDDGKKISAKANNIPFMNFAFDFSITTIKLKNFQKFLIFTDGLVEDTQDLNVNLDLMLNDEEYISHIYKELDLIKLDDDTTIIKLVKK